MKQGNIGYQQTGYFKENPYGTTNTKDDLPSLNTPPDINATIKANPASSTVEIEGRETVLRPDLSALFLAVGKRHSQGGMPVNLAPDSFVYSDDKTLALTKKDHDLFELKKPSSKAANNTPSQVLKRNVDYKHYNTLVTILQDPKADELSKKTATRMLDKYTQTLGNVAYIQEQKKSFPQGIPDFAQNSAPVYDSDLKTEIMQQKQYAKYGGKIENPYKMATGGSYADPIDPYKNARTPQGGTTPTGFPNAYDRGQPYFQHWEQVLPGISKLDNKTAQSRIYDYMMKTPEGQKQISDMWQTYGLTNQGRHYNDLAAMTHNGRFKQVGDFTPDQLQHLKKGYTDGLFGARQMQYTPTTHEPLLGTMTPGNHFDTPPVNAPATPDLIPNEPTGKVQNGIPVNWDFTPYQKESQLYNLAKLASVKRYMPYRSHLNPVYSEPSLLNPEQAVADAKATAHQQTSALNTLNPILRNAQAAAAYGQSLNAIPQIRTQYDNQNAQITNQFRQYNNQLANNANAQNSQNDQQYYQQAIMGQQNFDNMKSYLGDQYMNNRMQDVQQNQSLAYNMLALGPNPAYGYDWKTGNFTRNDKNILDTQNSRGDQMNYLMSQLDQSGLDETKKWELKTKLMGMHYLGNNLSPNMFRQSPFRKGGTVAKNPYKNNGKY